MIETMIISELSEAEKKYKPINSSKEGYAVLKEEIEELADDFHDLNSKLGVLWYNIKEKIPTQQHFTVEEMYNISLDIIKEAIQVAAMCKRFQKDLGVEEIK
jgi:hypothetical protein